MADAKTLAGASPHAFAIAGLLGWPVAHSRSPVIHNFWLREHGIAGRYVLFPVPPERVGDALCGLAALSLRGCNDRLGARPVDRGDVLGRDST